MKISELLEHKRDIETICTENPKLPVKVSYTIAVNKQRIVHALLPYEEEQKRLFKGYSEDGVSIPKDSPNYIEFLEAFNELLNMDSDVMIRQFKIDDLGEGEIDMKIMDAMAFMIKEQ